MWMLSLALPTQISQGYLGYPRDLDFLDHRAAVFVRLLSIIVIARRVGAKGVSIAARLHLRS